MTQLIQRLSIYLKGGQTLSVHFNAEKQDVLNPQIDAFVKTLGDPEKKAGNFLFQGARVVLVHLADVSAVDVVNLVRKDEKTEAVDVAAGQGKTNAQA